MMAFTNAKEKQSPTIIGAGCRVTGDIKTDRTVQIHGQITGNVIAETIIIGRGGSVKGRIFAKNLFLHGTLEGPATVNIANIFSAAQMVGELSYNTLNITANTALECKLSKRQPAQVASPEQQNTPRETAKTKPQNSQKKDKNHE